MTLRELRDRASALAQRADTAREQYADALRSMDYERALARQIELERVETELSAASSRLYLRRDR